MALECEALRSHRSPSSSAMSWAETNRIFDDSCMLSLRRYVSPADASGSSTTIASPSIAPFFVPPKLSTSTPDVAREGAQRQAEGCRGVRDPRAVHVQAHAVPVDVVGDRAQLVDRVQRAELGGLRQRDHERLRAVLVAPAPRLAVDELGRELAVVGRDGQELDAGDPLGSAALVDVDVRGGCRDHGAPAGEHRLQPDDVRAGAVEDRERLDALAEVLDEDLLQPRGVLVLAVGDLVAVVGGGDRGEHLGMDAGVVVGGEAAEVRVVERGHGHPAYGRGIRPTGVGSTPPTARRLQAGPWWSQNTTEGVRDGR